jgi:hypothetical protein
MPSPLPVVLTSGKDLLYPPAYFCLKCILIVQRGFSLAFQAFICHSLIKLTPPLLFLYHHAFLLFNSLQCSTLYYIHIQMSCFHVFHSLKFFPSPASHSPFTADPLMQFHDLSHYVCVYVCMIRYEFCVYLTCRSSFHIYGKTCNIWHLRFHFLSLAYFI